MKYRKLWLERINNNTVWVWAGSNSNTITTLSWHWVGSNSNTITTLLQDKELGVRWGWGEEVETKERKRDIKWVTDLLCMHTMCVCACLCVCVCVCVCVCLCLSVCLHNVVNSVQWTVLKEYSWGRLKIRSRSTDLIQWLRCVVQTTNGCISVNAEENA